jgi:two-component system sensor kinase FixL
MKELQSEMFHMSRFTVMGEMAANLAHELNQPLTAIVNYLKGSNRILERMEGPQVAMLRDAHNEVAGQALRAGNVIRHLREFVARGESERAIEELQELIREATHLALVGTKDSGIKVAFDFAHRTPFVLVNRTQIQQTLLNLIRNAIEAMEHPGKSNLVIKTEDILSESMVQVSVIDTGQGIAPAILDKLFTPFTTTRKSGMGMGLSICRTIIAAHGGKLWAESLPQKGSTFHFTLRTVEKGENSDDGELTAHVVDADAARKCLEPRRTPVQSPQSNGMAEAFVRTIKRDYVRVSSLPDASTVLENLPLWFEHYNSLHPHKALGYRSPREFIASRQPG